MSQRYENTYGGGAAITPSDSVQQTWSGIYVGGAGNVAVVLESGATVTFIAPPVGTILPVRVQKVNSTNTTATNLVGLQ